MPKKIDDFIVSERRKTIRDIPVPERSQRSGTPPPAFNKEHHLSPERRKHGGSKKRFWIVLVISLLIFAFAALSFFDGATLSYVPKSAQLSFSGDVYTARKTSATFPYSVVKLSKESGKEVSASGTQEVKRKANGTIVVYNNASAEPQRLVENTRFQTPEGKVYRIQNPITIPGKTSQPGSIEVTVYADETGESYNIGLSDFTLPGLTGTPRFQTIYARSKTPMSGGFAGLEAVVNDEDKIAAETELRKNLEEELMSEAKAQMPEGFIMFPGLVRITFESLPQTAGTGTNSANVKVRANFAGIMLKESDLSLALAKSKINLSKDESIELVPLEALNISFVGEAPGDLASSEEVNLSVTGESRAVWRTDEVALKSDLAGRNKKDVASILGNYPTIVSAAATVKPFWKSAFPSDQTEITIKELQAQ